MRREGNHIYFIGPIDGGYPVKIGFSACPPARLKQLMAWSPVDLCIIASAPGGQREETKIHYLLRVHWLRHEWFRDAPEVRALVSHVAANGKLPDEMISMASVRYRDMPWRKPRRDALSGAAA